MLLSPFFLDTHLFTFASYVRYRVEIISVVAIESLFGKENKIKIK